MAWKKIQWSDDAAAITVRKNSGSDIGTRPRLNFVEGSNISLAISDDSTGNEIDISVAVDTGVFLANGTRDLTKGILKDATELTISSGAVTATQSWHTIDTESNNATDDLVTINGGGNGQILVILPASGARTVVVKNGSGVNGVMCGTDFTMDSSKDVMTLMFSELLDAWIELSRSDNGA